jgi:hypothetical protein
MSGGGIGVRIDDRTWIITLDRPDRLNALDAATVDGLLAEMEKAKSAQDRARSDLYRATCTQDPDKDLAALVRSAARRGLKDRLLRYAAR